MRGGACCAAVLMLLLLVVGANKALCFESSSSTLARPEQADVAVLRDDYPKLELHLQGLSPRKYREFIAELRQSLASSEEVWTLPVLRRRGSVPMSQRFVLVDLTNIAGETATLALDVTNVYVVGYRVGDDSFFTMPDNYTRNAITHLFVGTQRHTFPFSGGYGPLTAAAGHETRGTILLGADALDAAVTSMSLHADSPAPPFTLRSVARGLIVCIQMISEAARFRYIEREMRSRIREGDSIPDPSILELENEWGHLSERIQTSDPEGLFHTPVRLQRRNYSDFYVSSLETVLPWMGILIFSCRRTPPSSLLAAAAGDTTSSRIMRRLVTSDPTCPTHAESTWHIVGPGGLCLDVRDGSYNNSNPVQLWPCKSNDDVNQLWTFTSDGTLRSNGKCLASYGYKPGDYIMIYDCRPGVDAFTWHPWPNGTIVSASGLVLSAVSSASGTTLSARINTYATGQSWLPTNSTDPSVHQIAAGLSGRYCLHADGDDDVVLRECANMEEEGSWWARYPDSSIRPDQARHLCLAPPDPTQVDRPLKMLSCDPDSSLQRWLFGNDGTIINVGTGLVMDVQGGSAMPGAHLTLNAYFPEGIDTQDWMALL